MRYVYGLLGHTMLAYVDLKRSDDGVLTISRATDLLRWLEQCRNAPGLKY